jgi:integrase
MATIRKRGDRWQVQIRRQGSPALARTFTQKRDAEAWAREAEARLDRGEEVEARRQIVATSLGDLLARYRDEVTPTKRSAAVERYRIGRMLRDPIASEFASRLTPGRIAGYRDERMAQVSGETVRQDLVLLRQVLETARREWCLPIARNPADDVRKPPPSKARTRRFRREDAQALSEALARVRNPLITEIITFAVATGMRRGEILAIQWPDIDRGDAVLLIPLTKNGRPRTIPLTEQALVVLERVRSFQLPGKLVFPISANAFKLAWQRLVKASGIIDLRFHDLRHEAVSRFFEAGLSLPEVALISGHRDPRQLMRYTHLDAARLSQKLRFGFDLLREKT